MKENTPAPQYANTPPHAQAQAESLGLEAPVAPVFLQTSLKVGAPDDPLEKEADYMADQVIQRLSIGNISPSSPDTLQRTCQACEEEETLQRKISSLSPSVVGTQEVPRSVKATLSAAQSGGAPLTEATRAEMEGVFGTDFQEVRIHAGDQATQLNEALNARAFTHGTHVYFNQGEYQPDSTYGKHLLAHELTHVVQQGAATHSPLLQHQQILQRSCDNLAEEFTLEDLSAAEERQLTSRVRECAANRLDELRRFVATLPDNPADAQAISAERRAAYGTLLETARNSIASIQTHEDEPNRRIRLGYIEATLDLLQHNKLFYYWTLISYQFNIHVLQTMGDPSTTLPPDQLERVTRFTRSMSQDPERYILADSQSHIYNSLNISPPDFGESAYTGGSNDDLVVNAQALPAEIIGAHTHVKNATGVYTMRLDYSIAGRDLLSQVVEAMNWVDYTWEVYDITDLYEQRIEEQIARQEASRPENAAEGLANPLGPTETDVELERMQQDAPDESQRVGRMAAARRRWERLWQNQIEDAENNLEDALTPSAGSDGTTIDTISTQLIADFNLASTAIAATFATVSEVLYSFVDLLGGTFYEKEIPFPDKEGWFLIRCIAQPSPQGDENPIVRPASVATKIVRVKEIYNYAESQLSDIDAALAARETELTTTLLFVTDPTERERIQTQLSAIETEQTGSTVQVLASRIQQLVDRKEQTRNPIERRRIDAQLTTLRSQLSTARARLSDFSGTILRPRAVFISEETSQTYPLLFQLGATGYNPITHQYHYKLSDVSRPDGDEYEGYGEGEILEVNAQREAIERAFNQFARSSPYGRGILRVGMPPGSAITLDQEVYDCEQRGGAQAVQRLEQVATTLTLLALFAIPGAGGAAAVVGAGIAAARLIHRISNHTFRWDTAAITDIISILGAAASGAAMIGRMRVVRTARMFALVADDADIVQLIQTMNRTASRLELVDDFLNWGGYMWGQAVMLNELIDLQIKEISGQISHAEARRQRANKIASAIRDGAFQFAGFDPEETRRRVQDSMPVRPHGREGSPEGSPSHTPTEPPLAPETPGERIPRPEAEGPLPGLENTPGDRSAVPDARSQAPSPEVVQTRLSRLASRIGELPFALRELLSVDHRLLARAVENRGVITPENVQAWNEIAQMAPMHPDTYPQLLADAALRGALLDNPAARHALKHCASPCFPANASASDIVALQSLIAARTQAGAETDFRQLNEFLYEHRSLHDLGDIIAMLRADFDGTLSQLSIQTALVVPRTWAEGSAQRPPYLSTVLRKLGEQHVPQAVINSVLAAIHAQPSAQHVDLIGALNSFLSQRHNSELTVAFDRILYGLSDPATAAFSIRLMQRASNNSSVNNMRVLLGQFNVPELHELRQASNHLEEASFFNSIEVLTGHIALDSAATLQDLINRAGYPPPEGTAIHPDIDRLLQLLNRHTHDAPLSPAEVRALIAEANEIRGSVSADNFGRQLDAAPVRERLNQDGNLVGALLSYLSERLNRSDLTASLIEQIIGAGGTEREVIARFGELSSALRDQISEFIRSELDDPQNPMSERELNTLVNRTFGPLRGTFFELVFDTLLRQELGDNNVWAQVQLYYPNGSNPTRNIQTNVDSITLQREGNILTVTFYEYKTGANDERGSQSGLRRLIEAGAGIDQLDFDSPRGREVLAAIQAAQQAGLDIQLQHRLIEENPANIE